MSNHEPSDVVGDRVRDIRKRQDMTVEQLAERCAAVGVPHLTPGVLYLIEGGGRGKAGKRGRRRVTVEELLGIAVALTVPPVVLLLPEDADATYELTPRLIATAENVFGWVIGQRPFPGDVPQSLAEVLERVANVYRPSWMSVYDEERMQALVSAAIGRVDFGPLIAKALAEKAAAQVGGIVNHGGTITGVTAEISEALRAHGIQSAVGDSITIVRQVHDYAPAVDTASSSGTATERHPTDGADQ